MIEENIYAHHPPQLNYVKSVNLLIAIDNLCLVHHRFLSRCSSAFRCTSDFFPSGSSRSTTVIACQLNSHDKRVHQNQHPLCVCFFRAMEQIKTVKKLYKRTKNNMQHFLKNNIWQVNRVQLHISSLKGLTNSGWKHQIFKRQVNRHLNLMQQLQHQPF